MLELLDSGGHHLEVRANKRRHWLCLNNEDVHKWFHVVKV